MLTRFWLARSQTLAYRGRMLWFGTVLIAVLWGILRPEGPQQPFPNSDWELLQHFAVGLHMLAFLALGLTARFAFSGWPRAWVWLPLLLAAPALEILQAMLQPDSRQFSVLDIGGNLLGVILAMSLWPWVKKGL